MLQISSRPLSASGADAALFVDRRAESRAVAKGISLGFNVLVLGERRSGRTSFLRHLERDLDDARSVFVDLGSLDSARPRLRAIADALATAAGDDPSRTRGTAPLESLPPDAVYQPDVTDMASASEDPRTILLDNVDPGFAQLLFGRFRDVLWQFPHRWIVAGELDRRTQYLEQPADAFFDVIVELEELSTQDAIELLRRRAEAAGDLAEASRLRELAPAIADAVPERTPGRLLGAARLALLGGSLGDAGELQRRAAALGRSAALLFAEVEALGPVHAGDQRLLRRLGYTRPRIVQLLKELEEGGLVVARPEGRRKMYEVAKPQREKATVPT